MATTKSFQLYINEDNVKQYFSTSGGTINGASIGGKYITMRTSSTTANFTMKDAGRDVLFPSAEAKANKIEVWAQAIATANSSKNTLNVAVAGNNAIATQTVGNSLKDYNGSVTGSFAKSNTSVVYTIKVSSFLYGAGVRDTSITAYFTQYACAANAIGNGISSVNVSNPNPYQGETTTFSATIITGATWHGWYSDAAHTDLVSTNLNYTAAANDITLYAFAEIAEHTIQFKFGIGVKDIKVRYTNSNYPNGNNYYANCPYAGGATSFTLNQFHNNPIELSAESIYSGYNFKGWYVGTFGSPDAVLISSARNCTYTPTAPCSIFAIGEEREGTGFYVKQNGQYKEVQVVLKKINGVWQEVQASELSRTANYVMRS